MEDEAYVAARESLALSILADRGLLLVKGPDRQKFLNNILSNDIAGLAPGQGRLAALMTVKGGLVATMRTVATADSVVLEVDGGRLDRLEAALTYYKVGAPVRFARPAASVLALIGPKVRETLHALGGRGPEGGGESHVETRVAGQEVRAIEATDLPVPALVLHVAREGESALLAALKAQGALSLDEGTLDVLRIEDGKPWYGRDIGEDNLLHETGLLGSHHSSTKGCYVGQEVVARLEGRGGHVNKSLRGLRLGAPGAKGDALLVAGREVGRITTAGFSPRFGPIALAYVHRDYSDAGNVVEVGGLTARVVDTPLR